MGMKVEVWAPVILSAAKDLLPSGSAARSDFLSNDRTDFAAQNDRTDGVNPLE